MKKMLITLTLLLGLTTQMTYPILGDYAESANNGLKHGIQNGISDFIREPLKHWAKEFAKATSPWLKEHKEAVALTAGALVLAVIIYSYFKKKNEEPCVVHSDTTLRKTDHLAS